MTEQSTKFGIQFEKSQLGIGGFVPALAITDEISVLLQQEGIDPSGVNKLKIPSGLSNVGTMTILCYLPSDKMLLPPWTDEPEAVFGDMWWVLSNNFRIHRIFAQHFRSTTGIGSSEIETLAVLSIDDWRYDLQLETTGATIERSTNSYNNDWSVGETGEDELEIGLTPRELLGVLSSVIDLKTLLPDIPSLDDVFNSWGHETGIGIGGLADRILASCGMVAVPDNIYSGESNRMRAVYIGSGWDRGSESYLDNKHLYQNGQLRSAWTLDPECFTCTTNAYDPGEDAMLPFVQHEGDHQSIEAVGAIGVYQNYGKVPSSLNIQFPAKDTKTGKIIMYQFTEMYYCQPMEASGPPITITDHIKTRVTINEGLGSPILNDEGITTILIGGPGEVDDDIEGLDEDRLNILASRALHLSRTYYARCYALVGTQLFHGFISFFPWSGLHVLEYGFDFRGMPYTKTFGDAESPLFGFTQTDFAQTSVITSGNSVMMSRPDGLVDLAISGGVSNPTGLLYKITGLTANTGGCTFSYDIESVDDPSVYWQGVVPTDRVVADMCYEPAVVPSLCIFAFIPTEPDDDPGCSQDGCNYVFLAGEEVKTKVCQ